MNLSKEDELIFAAVKLNISNNEKYFIENVINKITNWAYFIELAIINGVSPILYKNFLILNNFNAIPQDIINKLKEAYYKTLRYNIVLHEQFSEIIKIFNENKIDSIALKGLYLAETIYEDIGLRQMSDIDLLIKKQDIEKACNLLIQNGFTDINLKLKRDFHLNKHYNFCKSNIMVELHQHVHSHYENFNINIDKYWERSIKTNINNMPIYALSHQDMLQHLCLHLHSHIQKGKFSLIGFCDINYLIKKYENSLNWDLFINDCTESNCLIEISNILYIAKKYFNTGIKENIFLSIKDNYNSSFEKIFSDAFHNKRHGTPNQNVKIKKIKNLKGVFHKINYIFDEIFQTKAFMIYYYKPKYKSLFFIYYPLRLLSLAYKYILFVLQRYK